jgi:hypothetical protein
MFDDFEAVIAIQKLYEYFDDELREEDFILLSEQDVFMSNIADIKRDWYLINPEKTLTRDTADPDFFIVTTQEKLNLLRAVSLTKAYTSKLPADTCFSERLIYAKKALPSGDL